MFFEKYKDLFLNDASKGQQQGNIPRQNSTENAKHNVFSRNAEMLMGNDYGSSNPRLRDLNVDYNSFNNPHSVQKPIMKPPMAEYTKPPAYEPPKRSMASRENQRGYGLGQATENVQQQAYGAGAGLNRPIVDVNNKANDSKTSPSMKNAFEWRETTTAEPSRRKGQARNSQSSPAEGQQDIVFGAFDRREHDDLLVTF